VKINIGPSVEGDDFFGREKELKWMGEILEPKKGSLFIPGPRRIGKTSLVKEFIRQNKNKYKFVYFDLEFRNSIIEMCEDLLKEIKKNFPALIKAKSNLKKKWNDLSKMFPEISVGGVIKVKTGEVPLITKKITDKMEEVFEELYPHNFIIAFDEFSDFLWNLNKSSNEDMELFLKWLRYLRQEEKIKVIITGSINIISTVEELRVPDLINDLPDLDILPLNPGEIKELLTELLKGKNITLSKEVMDFALTKLSDGVPFFIQLLADGIYRYSGGNTTIAEVKEIETLYGKITGKRHKEFVDLHTRLESYLPEHQFAAARKILANTALKPMNFDDIYPYVEKMLPDKQEVNKLLRRLEDECYLYKEKGFYRFVSPMIADWWKNMYAWEK
jgi:AAA+ ATPase superfamily predicted ATPase